MFHYHIEVNNITEKFNEQDIIDLLDDNWVDLEIKNSKPTFKNGRDEKMVSDAECVVIMNDFQRGRYNGVLGTKGQYLTDCIINIAANNNDLAKERAEIINSILESYDIPNIIIESVTNVKPFKHGLQHNDVTSNAINKLYKGNDNFYSYEDDGVIPDLSMETLTSGTWGKITDLSSNDAIIRELILEHKKVMEIEEDTSVIRLFTPTLVDNTLEFLIARKNNTDDPSLKINFGSTLGVSPAFEGGALNLFLSVYINQTLLSFDYGTAQTVSTPFEWVDGFLKVKCIFDNTNETFELWVGTYYFGVLEMLSSAQHEDIMAMSIDVEDDGEIYLDSFDYSSSSGYYDSRCEDDGFEVEMPSAGYGYELSYRIKGDLLK